MYQLKAFIVATTPTACGIETALTSLVQSWSMSVATTPTACGIETDFLHRICLTSLLQQHLSITVLKLVNILPYVHIC